MHRPSAVLATVLFTFAITATASASSYCVAPATGCDNTASSLLDALNQTANHPGDDSISLGAATYAEDGLVYNPFDHARVSITGAGQDATTIRPNASTNNSVTLQGLQGPIDLARATVLTGNHGSNIAIQLQYGGNVDRLAILQDVGAVQPTGMEAGPGSAITNSRFAVAGTGTCVAAFGSGTVSVSDSTLGGCAHAVGSTADRMFAQRLRIADVGQGINVMSGTANLDDSVVQVLNDAVFVNSTGAAPATLYANQDTLIGPGGGVGVRAYNHTGTGLAKVDIYDSIIRGFATPLSVDSLDSGHPATMEADFDNYEGTPSGVTPTHVSTDDPLFVDAAHGDYHLQAASPVIDLDPEPIVTLWNESATDLDGSLRIINGKRDYGAFERPLPPGAATAPATDVTQTSAMVPASANGGGATATVKLVYGPTASFGTEIPLDAAPADLADHPYSIPLSGLSPSTTYHYALVVTNSAGTTTSADQTLTTGSPPPTVCCAPPPVAKAALSGLKISPSRFKAASKGATFAKAKTGTKVTYTLSAAGTVKFRVLRAAKGVKSGGRCVAKSRKRRTGKACTRYVAVGRTISRASPAGRTTLRLSGRVGGKKLKPGRYRLQSLDPAGATKRATFRIVRG